MLETAAVIAPAIGGIQAYIFRFAAQIFLKQLCYDCWQTRQQEDAFSYSAVQKDHNKRPSWDAEYKNVIK